MCPNGHVQCLEVDSGRGYADGPRVRGGQGARNSGEVLSGGGAAEKRHRIPSTAAAARRRARKSTKVQQGDNLPMHRGNRWGALGSSQQEGGGTIATTEGLK